MKLERQPLKKPTPPRSADFLQPEPMDRSVVFDPWTDLPVAEREWIKNFLPEKVNKSGQGEVDYVRATSWMRWIDPGYVEWVKQNVDPKQKMMTGYEFFKSSDVVRAVQRLSEILELYPEERNERPEFIHPRALILPGEEREVPNQLALLASMLLVWPEKREACLTTVLGVSQSETIKSIMQLLPKLGPNTFLDVVANLRLIFPELESQIHSLFVQRAPELKTLLAREKTEAIHQKRSVFPVWRYQRILRDLTILEAGSALITDQGEIKLTPKAVSLGGKKELPPRSHT